MVAPPLRIAVLASGGGTNLQALIDKQSDFPEGFLALVLTSRADAYALERARQAGIPTAVVVQKDYPVREEFTEEILRILQKNRIDLVILAGFMFILSPRFCDVYEGRVVNVHPALIPSFCGKGFYGLRVHQAALDYGVKVTGATVHIVTPGADEGPILLQRALDICEDDTPESLQQRVMTECEHVILPQAVGLLCRRILLEKS